MDTLKVVVDYGVIGLLLALSIWSVAIAVERWLFYRRIDLAQFPNSLRLEMALTKHLSSSARWPRTLRISALLGTVLGIMLTFHTMGTSGTMAVNAIMIGLEPRVESHGGGTAGGDSLCRHEQCAAAARDRTLARYKEHHGTGH